jgi:FKBP-type peptidyl-prolyl cis-trans isomerase FklB
MTKHLICSLAAAALMTSTLHAQDKLDLKDAKQRSSYAIGIDIGSNMKRQEIELDSKALAAGIIDALGGKPQLKDEEVKQAIMELRTQLMAKAEAREKAAAQTNVKAGEDFLAANAKKEGVKTTTSGLQYKVLKAGDGKGKTPKASDTVKVHYHGTLIDGSVFDSSVQRGEPAEFPVNGVIAGWTEVLQLMKEGDKWQVYIPSKLAYGEQSPSPKIGPNATLVFDVELLQVK